jgi:hypothetical protein
LRLDVERAAVNAIRAWFIPWRLDLNNSDQSAEEVIGVAAPGDLACKGGAYRFVMNTPDAHAEEPSKPIPLWKKIGAG